MQAAHKASAHQRTGSETLTGETLERPGKLVLTEVLSFATIGGR